ncbi:6-carboxyhexanoate--CoA ligase [Corynebacterium hindlerae]|uniref:6-carboxyhexanoate--CoA ligase n=1 Tax=Corynebacterium hindlerae TaxID=699041 RepID=A0A7G5FE54_9CORY|nr:6-carboxyhexanoate--CoA ligase [Corynebacterium hindlerae]QMV84895.1 6-carboxyhexanoate--CoA ligase [Corynebacterium hindlerae]
MSLYSIKMRASRAGAHISGAERIVPQADIATEVSALTERALTHPHGVPDSVNIKTTLLTEEITRVPALQVVEVPQSQTFIPDFLREHGLSEAAHELLYTVTGLRGAMLIDAHTGERLDPNEDRGVRVTNMDHVVSSVREGKQHFAEAMALASKVNFHPNIVAELCISDDPNYTTGYVAHEGTYYRLANCKEPGATIGTRVFLYNGPQEEIADTIDYLEHTPVLVEGWPCT